MSTNQIKDSDGFTPAHYWAIGGMIMLVSLGIGGCEFLSQHHRSSSSAQATNAAPTPSR